MDEMSLIVIAQLKGQISPVQRFACLHPLDQVVQSEPSYHPLWRCSYIFSKEPLQRSFADLRLVHQVIQGKDVWLLKNLVDDSVGPLHVFILGRHAQKK